jgi:ABC-type branched-subunit amino acid transport system substrate-binding protein
MRAVSMRRRVLTVGGLVAALGGAYGCRLILGSLDECSKDTDCASRGPTLVCKDSLCVADPRCSVFGSQAANAITFGLVLPLTIDGETAGQNAPHWRDVVKLIVDEINPPVQQGVGGRPVRVIACDTSQNADVARDLASLLVSRGVPAIIANGSSETLNVAAVTVPARVLIVTGSAQTPQLTSLPASPDIPRQERRRRTSTSTRS